MRISTWFACTNWLSFTSTSVTKPLTRGAITVTSPPTYASSVVSIKRPTRYQYEPAPNSTRTRKKPASHIQGMRRVFFAVPATFGGAMVDGVELIDSCAYALHIVKKMRHQAPSLPFRCSNRLLRQIEQFLPQRRGTFRAEMPFKFLLRIVPVACRLLELLEACRRQTHLKRPAIGLRCVAAHKAVTLQRLDRANQRGALHHHPFGQFLHRDAGSAANPVQDRELRDLQTDLADVLVVDLRYETRGLPDREAIVGQQRGTNRFIFRVHIH